MMDNMRFTIVEPKLIRLISTNVPDSTAYPAWVAEEAVAVNQYRVYKKYIFRANEAIATTDTPDISPIWYAQQPVNSMAMLTASSQELDDASETTASSVMDGDMEVTITFKKSNLLAIMGVEGSRVEVEEVDAVTDAHIKTTEYKVVNHKGVSSIYEYLFRNFEGAKRVSNIIHPLTLNFDHKIKVRVYGLKTKITFLCAGMTEQFGCTQFNPTKSAISVRPPDRNAFGNVRLIKGNTYVKIDCDIKFPTKDFDTLSDRLEALNNVAILFLVVNDSLQSFQQFGFFSSIRQVLSNQYVSDASLVMESFLKGGK